MDERTLFRIASISKLFTATTVVQLRDRGVLRLDDPAVRYVPELAQARNPFGPIEEITIRRLLNHTSGLGGETDKSGEDVTYPWHLDAIDAVLADPARIRVVDAPGSAWRYSNVGYALLSAVVSRVTGRPYWDVLRTEILDPLGMDTTGPEPAGEVAGRRATGYDRYAYDERLAPAAEVESGWNAGNGDLWSSVEDLARWISAQFVPYGAPATSPEILAPASLREMHRQTTLADAKWTASWGLGWAGARNGDLVTIGHSGALPGFVTGIDLCLPERVGAINLFNGWPGRSDWSLNEKLLGIALPVIAKERAARTLPAVQPLPADARELLGSYWDPESGDRYHVAGRSGSLCLLPVTAKADESWPRLEPAGTPLRYVARDEEGREQGSVVFVRNASGAIKCLTLDGFTYQRETPAAGRG